MFSSIVSPPSATIITPTLPTSTTSYILLICHYLHVYGIQIVITFFLSAITVYRREMSCNRVHHGDTPTKATTTTTTSTTDNSTVSNSIHSNRIPSRGGKHNHRSSSSIHKSCDEVVVAPINDPSDTATTDPIDAALLVEEASFDCSFSPILSIVIFLYRIIQVIACKSILRPYLKPSKADSENNKAHDDDVYDEGNNNTLWKMLALEWWHCAQRGFSYQRHSSIDDSYINNYQMSGLHQSISTTRSTNPSNSVSNSNATHNNKETTHVSHVQKLPSDVQFHMLNYLPVRDIIAFSTASKTTNECVHNPRIAFPFWNMLCQRDYSDVMTWNVMHARFQESMQRVYKIKQCVVEENSNVDNIVSFVSQWHNAEGKGCKQSTSLLPNNTSSSANQISDLYFILSQTWLPYSLAKHNTTKSCIVAIHNSIYDITNFLPYHPGSIETLLINSGSNATKWFEDVGHSKRARNMAEGMCVLNQGRNRYNGCVTRMKEELKRQETHFTDIAIRRLEHENVIGDVVHVVFDFVVGGWCAWYTTLTEEGSLESVLVYLEED